MLSSLVPLISPFFLIRKDNAARAVPPFAITHIPRRPITPLFIRHTIPSCIRKLCFMRNTPRLRIPRINQGSAPASNNNFITDVSASHFVFAEPFINRTAFCNDGSPSYLSTNLPLTLRSGVTYSISRSSRKSQRCAYSSRTRLFRGSAIFTGVERG